MKVAIVGTGYVGLPTGVCLAELGHNIICIDKDESKIKLLKQLQMPLFEIGLDKLFKKNVEKKRLTFTTDMKNVKDVDIVIIAVGTPTNPTTNETDMSYVFSATTELSKFLEGYTLIATKSTVPIGTNDHIEAIISNNKPKSNFDVISLPEFLREGLAIEYFFKPDRIIVGTNSNKAKNLIKDLYSKLNHETEFVFVSRKSAETIKYASNAFLAMKINYINELADFCEETGANIHEVSKGIGLDKRIGKEFLTPGPGYGGPCLPKDTLAMTQIAKNYGIHLSLIETMKNNKLRKKKMASKILDLISDIKEDTSVKVAILGLTFKKNTDDCRDSPSIEIINILLKKKMDISVYDPKGMENAKLFLKDKVIYAKNEYEAVNDADVLVVLTEWEKFKRLDMNEVKKRMKHHNIIDLRNLFEKDHIISNGFNYIGIGDK